MMIKHDKLSNKAYCILGQRRRKKSCLRARQRKIFLIEWDGLAADIVGFLWIGVSIALEMAVVVGNGAEMLSLQAGSRVDVL